MNRLVIVSSLIMLVFLASLSVAEIPRLINYQGMLTDDLGNPLEGDFAVFFRIYNAQSGGEKRWEESHAVVSVSKGLFNVILGSQSGGIELDFSETYWLEIQVENDTMPERLEFTSVGYAYRALTADSALATAPGSGSNWHLSNSVLYTNQYWGIARGGAGNALFGDSAYSHVNLGTACTTGTNGSNYRHCVVGGGRLNSASNEYTTVGGGIENRATGWGATIAGGYWHLANGQSTTIGGGEADTASSDYATVAGGYNNRATNYAAAVGGGYDNLASGDHATVAGGSYNSASGHGATVSGGDDNSASGEHAIVSGGRSNTASGNYSFAAGYRAKAEHHGSFVWADSTAAAFASTGPNQFLIRASGGVGIGTTNPGQKLDVDLGNLVVQGSGSFDSTGEEGIVYLGSVHHYIKGVYGFGVKIGTYAAGDVVSIREVSGNVGIGTTDPGSFKLAVSGSAAKTGGGSWDVFSDLRLKQINAPYEYGLPEISRLNPVRYSYKEDNLLGLPSGEEFVGLIAQEVEEVIPDAVNEDDKGYLTLNNDPIIWAMLNAIKELKAENEALKKRMEALEGK